MTAATKLASLELRWVLYWGKRLGISYVVRYLRNPNPSLTVRILRSFGATVGEGTTLKRSLFIDNAYEDRDSAGDFHHVKIGNNCYIGDCIYLDLANEIVLEDNVVVAANVSIITHADCNRSTYLDKHFPRKCDPVVVKNGAWLGAHATVLSGVTIGEHCVIAAGSLVNQNTSPRCVYAGVPAKNVRSVEDHL